MDHHNIAFLYLSGDSGGGGGGDVYRKMHILHMHIAQAIGNDKGHHAPGLFS